MIEDFKRDGFVIVDRFFSEEELQDFAYVLECTEVAMHGREIGEVYDAVCMTPAFLRLTGKRATEEIVNTLLDRDPYGPLYCAFNRCLMQRPGDESHTYGWHQETFYSVPDSSFVQTWAPLVRDTDEQDGTIEVCAGSHRAGVAPQTWEDRDGGATQIIVDRQVTSLYFSKPVPMKLGQMMFFDSRLFHRSGKNTSDHTRYSLVGQYHDIAAPGFRTPRPRVEWRGQSPRQAWERSR